jgi:hypothetical protein
VLYRLRAMNIRRSPLALLVAVALVAAACESGPNLSDRPTGADEMVLGVAVVRGDDTTAARLLGAPSAALFGDGRLIRPGPQVELYPGPALPVFSVTQLNDSGVQAILTQAGASGIIGADQELRFPVVKNPPITVFVVFVAGVRHQTIVEALDEVQPDDPRLSPASLKQREAMKVLIALVTNPRAGLAGDVVGDDTPYEPKALRLIISPVDPSAEPNPVPPTTRDWPLATGLAGFGAALKDAPNVRCGTVEGADFATLYPLAKESNELTRWASGGVEYTVRFRPLLPGESGCGS